MKTRYRLILLSAALGSLIALFVMSRCQRTSTPTSTTPPPSETRTQGFESIPVNPPNTINFGATRQQMNGPVAFIAPNTKYPYQFRRISGISMEPYLHSGDWATIAKIPFADLKDGMVVARGNDNSAKLHVVYWDKRREGWRCTAANHWVGGNRANDSYDLGFLTEKDYVGVWWVGSAPKIVPVPFHFG